jgi:hypothetical protein
LKERSTCTDKDRRLRNTTININHSSLTSTNLHRIHHPSHPLHIPTVHSIDYEPHEDTVENEIPVVNHSKQLKLYLHIATPKDDSGAGNWDIRIPSLNIRTSRPGQIISESRLQEELQVLLWELRIHTPEKVD